MQDRLIRNFEHQFPFLIHRVISYQENDIFELVVRLDDGEIVLYDDMLKAIRTLPNEDELTIEDNFTREFGKRLRSVLCHKCITQQELSEMTGIPRPILSRYITGKTCPSLYKANKIARALDCSLDELWCSTQ